MKVHVSGTHFFCGGQEGTNPMKGWWITASDTVPVLRSALAWLRLKMGVSRLENIFHEKCFNDHHFTIKAAIFRAPKCDIKTPSTRPGVVCLDSLAPDWTRWNRPWRGHYPPVVGAVDAAKNQWDQVGSRDLQWYIIFIYVTFTLAIWQCIYTYIYIHLTMFKVYRYIIISNWHWTAAYSPPEKDFEYKAKVVCLA